MESLTALGNFAPVAVLRKIATLEKQIVALRENVQRTISHAEAKQLIHATLEMWRKQGRTTADVISLHAATHLPLLQINELMEELEKEGKVHGENFPS